MPEDRGTASLIFLCDHGREAPVEWKSHGEKIPDSKYVWSAFLGPDTVARGERSHVRAVTRRQLAATIVALRGEDYAGARSEGGQAHCRRAPGMR